MSISRNPSPEISQALAEAVLTASRQQSVILGWAFCTGGIYERLGRDILTSAQAAASREYPPPPGVMTIDAEYTVGEAKHE